MILKLSSYVWCGRYWTAALMALAGLAPVLIYGFLMWDRLIGQHREQAEHQLSDLAGTVSRAVDRNLKGALDKLRILTTSLEARGYDLDRFREAVGFAEQLEFWRGVALVDRDGRQVFNTAAPADIALPAAEHPLEVSEVFSTGRVLVGGIKTSGSVIPESYVALHAPVSVGGVVQYVLTAAMRPAALQDIVLGHHSHYGRPLIAVLDRDLRIAARSRLQSEFVGREASPSLAEKVLEQKQGLFISFTQEGDPVYTAFARSPDTGWTVAVGLPLTAVEEPLRESRIVFGSVGVLLSALGIGTAMGFFSWVSARRQTAEAARGRSESLLAEITDNIPGAVFQFEMDKDGTMRLPFMSAGLATTYGIAPAEATPEAILTRVVDEDRAAVDRSIRESAELLRPWTSEWRILTPNGERWIRGYSVPTWTDGWTVRWNGLLVDVTEEKALRRQLLQAQRLDAVGQLTGGVAHDFNNLLGITIGNLDLLEGRVQGDAEGEELLHAALEASLRGAELTKQLLAFARRQPLRPQRVGLNGLVAQTTRLLQRILGERVRIKTITADPECEAEADPTQIEAALTNLAINARDAMPQGGQLTIETAVTVLNAAYAADNPEVAAGEYVMLAVSDTGMGMTPEVLEQAFEPFFTTKGARGTGLGLSMVYGFAKQSRGHVKIYSEPGRGTVVRLYLPRAGDEPRGIEPEISEEKRTGQCGRLILVVEDNQRVRDTVRKQLLSLGYAVREAETAEDALALLGRGEMPDLLFTDLVLPGIDGQELARRARQMRPGLPVLLTSGFSEDIATCEGGEQFPLLTKPYQLRELARKIAESMNDGGQEDDASTAPAGNR